MEPVCPVSILPKGTQLKLKGVLRYPRSQEVVTQGSDDDNTVASGKQISLTVNIPPTFDDSEAKTRKSQCLITVLDHKNYSAEWKADSYPSMILRSYRVQRLREESRDDGTKVTIYESREAFGGLLARLVQWLVGNDLQKAFDAMADGLRERSELLAQQIS
jgi:hypothetical protein